MKKTLLLLTFLAFAKLASSQILIGLIFGDKLNKGPIEFGINLNTNTSTTTGLADPKYLMRLGFGLYFDFNLSDHFKLATGLFFNSPKGARNLQEEDLLFEIPNTLDERTIKRELNYIELPAEAYYVINPKLAIGGGGYLGYRHQVVDIIEGKVLGGDNTLERSTTGYFHKWDAGVQAHIRYHFNGDPGIQISVGYQRGLADIFKDPDLEGYNQSIQAAVLIPIKMGI